MEIPKLAHNIRWKKSEAKKGRQKTGLLNAYILHLCKSFKSLLDGTVLQWHKVMPENTKTIFETFSRKQIINNQQAATKNFNLKNSYRLVVVVAF